MEILLYPLAFLLLLGVIVVFHEYGHFIVARLSGVHVVRMFSHTEAMYSQKKFNSNLKLNKNGSDGRNN